MKTALALSLDAHASTIVLSYASPSLSERIAICGTEIGRAKSRVLILSECGGTMAMYVRSLKGIHVPRNLTCYDCDLPIFKTELLDRGVTYTKEFPASDLANFVSSQPFDIDSDSLCCYRALFGGSWDPSAYIMNAIIEQLHELGVVA